MNRLVPYKPDCHRAVQPVTGLDVFQGKTKDDFAASQRKHVCHCAAKQEDASCLIGRYPQVTLEQICENSKNKSERMGIHLIACESQFPLDVCMICVSPYHRDEKQLKTGILLTTSVINKKCLLI